MGTEEEFGEREFYRRLNRAISAGTVREKHIYPKLTSVFKGKITVGDYDEQRVPNPLPIVRENAPQPYIEPDDQVLSAPIIKGEKE